MKNGQKTFQKTRYASPKIKYDKKGKVEAVLCPFCKDPHPISADGTSMCGTTLELRAVQPTFTGRAVVCSRCGKSGGTMSKLGNNLYVHATPCAPTNFYAETPKLSLTAAMAFRLPDKALIAVTRFLKRTPEELVKIGQDGIPTKEIVGYHWKRIE